MTLERCDGILLAAGAGARYGMPKVLAEDGAWLRSAVAALRGGGCTRVFVVLGATGPAYRRPGGELLVSRASGIALPEGVFPVWAADWEEGIAASLRAGLAAAATVLHIRPQALGSAELAGATTPHDSESLRAARDTGPADFVAIMPVDTPDVGPQVVARVLSAARDSGLARAFFGATPGHPVVLGRRHWAGVVASARGNSGAGTYLSGRPDMVCVTCDDLATGIDRDYPAGDAR